MRIVDRRSDVCSSDLGVGTKIADGPLEVADDPCRVFLSSTGLLARTSGDDEPGDGGGRAKHDVIVSSIRSTARGEIGVLTNRGRVIRVGVVALPTFPPTANHPPLTAGLPVTDVGPLGNPQPVLTPPPLPPHSPRLAPGPPAPDRQ